MKARAIAFYLPQFHPIPENDAWWGKGFTEWTNVTKAKPLFPGHYQPHLPADLGFYDLRVPEVREAQARMARTHGIEGFCYYHYWFNGRRLLERPVNEILATGKPDFPFCLCWANENWTRRWDGHENEVLLDQKYSEEDDINHIKWLARVFQDPRYIQIDGKPLFLVYRISQLPQPKRTVMTWRSECHRLGLGDIYLCNVESHPAEHGLVSQYGLDAAVEFAPDWSVASKKKEHFFIKILSKLGFLSSSYKNTTLVSYKTLVNNMLQKMPAPYLRFPCVTPSWDNSPRRTSGATIFVENSPQLYKRWLNEIVRMAKYSQSEFNKPIIFINAWNEWGEGNHLEPCNKWGFSFLEATRDVIFE